MKIAIMQPYFFPYIGYFSLIQNTEHFIFFDTPQYIRKGWINRNRIIGGNGKDIYFTVPVEKVERNTAIRDVPISYKDDWREKMMGQLTIYKKRAPYYQNVTELVRSVINPDYGNISELAIASIKQTCEFMDMKLECDIYSEMSLPEFKIKAPDEWALYITKYTGYDTYVNPPGGKAFFEGGKYKKEGIELQFLSQELIPYRQRTKEFIPGLSIIDVLMFCSPDEIKEMMNHYILE
jgi:hypothetical protein